MKTQILWLSVLSVSMLAWTVAYAQITPLQDAYTNTASPTTNFGTKPVLDVESASQNTYIEFDLSSIPTGYTSANVAKATLKLYVNAVTTAGSFNVDFVNGTWSEKTITADLAPALGTTIASNVPLTAAEVHDYILIDVTTAVDEWLDGTLQNNGIALVANSPLNASFDSKENTTNSQSAELDIVLTGTGVGTITGVITNSSSGLTGGGTTGTLNLSIGSGGVTNAMLANSALTISAGEGLTGGGLVPLGGSTTLKLDTSKVPELGAANTFTANQSVTGNLSATGSVGVGTTTPATELDIFSSIAGVHTPIARFGSNGASDSNSTLIYNGTGVTEMFQAGFPNAFVTGTQAGDGGLRVTPSKSIFFGDNAGGQRMVITSGHNVVVNSTAPTVIGNTGCSGNFGGIGFGATSLADCAHYTLLGDTLNTYLNRPSGGQILFREGNNTEMIIAAGGEVGLGTTTTGSGQLTVVSHSNQAGAIAAFGFNAPAASNETGSPGVEGLGGSADPNATINVIGGAGVMGFGGNAGGGTTAQAAGGNGVVGQGGVCTIFPCFTDGAGGVFTGGNGGNAVQAGGFGIDVYAGSGGIAGRFSGEIRVAKTSTGGTEASFGGTGDFAVDASGVVAGRFVVKDTTGFVGINTPSPDNNLTVNGSADKPGGGSWGTFSDRRLKTLSGSFDSGLSQILKLNPVRYRYKDDNALGIQDREEHVGFVAQEVQKIIPEAVTKNDKGYLLVNNDPILWTMLNAIKEQQSLIHKQQEHIRLQHAQISQLIAQVKTIQAALNTSGRAGSEVRKVRTRLPVAHQ